MSSLVGYHFVCLADFVLDFGNLNLLLAGYIVIIKCWLSHIVNHANKFVLITKPPKIRHSKFHVENSETHALSRCVYFPHFNDIQACHPSVISNQCVNSLCLSRFLICIAWKTSSTLNNYKSAKRSLFTAQSQHRWKKIV